VDYVKKQFAGNFRMLESEFINKLLDIIKSYSTKNGYIGQLELDVQFVLAFTCNNIQCEMCVVN
jgi:hypothetical protein